MNKTGMMDRNAIGIRNVFDIQRNRLLPMPTYDLSEVGRVARDTVWYGTQRGLFSTSQQATEILIWRQCCC